MIANRLRVVFLLPTPRCKCAKSVNVSKTIKAIHHVLALDPAEVLHQRAGPLLQLFDTLCMGRISNGRNGLQLHFLQNGHHSIRLGRYGLQLFREIAYFSVHKLEPRAKPADIERSEATKLLGRKSSA
jgi:hypothetical protein